MKLLVVGHAYIAPINQEKWIVFAQMHPEVEVCVIFPHVWPDALFKLEGRSLQPLSNCSFMALQAFKTGNEVRYGYYPRALIKLLRTFKPDRIHVEQGDNAFSYFQILCLAKILCPKACFSFFTWVNWKPKWSLKYKIFWKWLERFNIKFSQGAIAGNHDAQDLLKDKGFVKKSMVLPQLGVTLEPLEKRQETKNIFFIGRITPEKGVFLLLQAFKNLMSQFKDWQLHFVGSGQSLEELKALALNDNQIIFYGSVGHDKVFDLLKQAAIFVLPSYDTPSWREQFGHVLIEAMALGVPVIGTNGGEIAHVVGDAGLVAEQNDLSSLQICLEKLMADDALRQDFGQRGYQRVASHFTHQVIAQKTYEFLKGL